MDTTSSNKGKGVMNAISTDGNPVDKQFKLFDGESLNQAPAPTTMPYSQSYMAPAPTTMPYSQSYMAPPNTFYGEPLDVAPLTVAKPGEPVDHTPSSILNHNAYKGGWKVLRYPRPGRVDKTYNHKDFGKLRSKKAVINLLDELWRLEQNEKKSDDQHEKSCGANQSAEGNGGASAGQSAERKDAAGMNQSAEGKSAVGASYSAKGKSATY
ncbi:hypothetical protein PVAP13_5NG224624 [Panicum virgatum]|uniref:Uncharacterized protein n=1 Tax=Panicum virgatum TaxID=38727 RepID=A0A8T0RWP5_PANVG|nr:hypothetical protein PVAP13_5NG224624 [Panicum virgatum]